MSKRSWLLLLSCPLFFTACNSSNDTRPDETKDDSTNEGGVAAHYQHDIGIEADPSVLFVEQFDDGMKNILARYQDVYNDSGMSLDPDVPQGSKGAYSIVMTNTGGKNTGGHLFKNFAAGFDSTVYIRYYVKYPSISKDFIHHEGIWIGGYNPATDYPNPRAGICGLGDSRISIAYEPVNDLMGSYVYWGEMQGDPSGNCWGNDFVNGSQSAQTISWDEWMCVEIMVKLNSPVNTDNGELRLWQNGVEVGHWKAGSPTGTMKYGQFKIDATGSPFKGFRWRTDAGLNINYIWIEFYDDKSAAGVSHYIKFDHLVMATKYIGPIKS